jgi:NitT/TauT family transport system substrate-binding protein
MSTSKNNMVRRRAFAFVGLFTIVALSFASATGVPESPNEPLRIIYPQTLSSIPFLMAIEENSDKYTGEFYSDHPQALAQLLAGEADVLATGFSFGLARYEAAGDLVHIGTTIWGISALMTSQEIDAWSDLAGGRIYAPFEGSPIDLFIRSMLELEGLEDEIEIRYAPFPQSAALVAQGDAEAAILVEPIASRLELAGQAFRFENISEGWARIANGEQRSPQISLFTTSTIAETRLAELQDLRSDVQAAAISLTANPGSYAREYTELLGFPAPVMEHAISNALLDAPDPATERAIIELYARLVGESLPGDDFYLDAP